MMQESKPDTTTRTPAIDTQPAIDTPDTPPPPRPAPKPMKQPSGAYHAMLPQNDGLEHIIIFYSNHTYELQERYKNDSVEKVRGTWAPSDNFIWAYKDQVVRARYRWKGNQLEYYNPGEQKGFPLNPMMDISQNKVWIDKKKEGVLFFGIGNEPFWSVEVNKNDSATFSLADWKEPLRFLTAAANRGDSLIFTSGDSLQITILPRFCSDGMSDYLYRQQVQVLFRNTTYNGCGMIYR